MIKLCKSIAKSNWFSNFIIGVIILAGVLVGIETNHEFAQAHAATLLQLNHFILFIFVVEMVIKIIAEGKKPWLYLTNSWNVFDFTIVVTGLIDLFLSLDASFVPVVRLFRLLRLLRVTRLVNVLPELQLLVSTLLRSISAIGYVGIMLFIIFYVYGVTGVFLFGDNDPIHFASLPKAFLTLSTLVTMEGWVSVMQVSLYGCDKVDYPFPELCTKPEAYAVEAPLFFVSFVAIGVWVVMNMFIGIILNSLEASKKQQADDNLLARKQAKSNTIFDEILFLQTKLDNIKEQLDIINVWVSKDIGNKSHQDKN